MSILNDIIRQKIVEIEKLKNQSLYPSIPNTRPTLRSMFAKHEFGIIAEFKLRSPSKGVLHLIPESVEDRQKLINHTVSGYAQAGALAVSILTDEMFFGGHLQDLAFANTILEIPILRKDFIIDELQIEEAVSSGANIILLIAACLSPTRLGELAKYAKTLGLEVLLEIHEESELAHLNPFVDFVGVNNRNLKTFEVSLQTSINLASKISQDFIKISESGLSEPESIKTLREVGYKGFLIGETFMKTDNPAQACSEFIKKINGLPTF
jgi:indole-3-glycerol phosphate synthase